MLRPYSDEYGERRKKILEGTQMKETVKTSRTAGYLEKMFRKLNEHYFASAIEEPIITIQSTPRAYGHVTISKAWRKSNGDRRHELNLDAGTLDRPIEEVVATLLHEMVHLANLQAGVRPSHRVRPTHRLVGHLAHRSLNRLHHLRGMGRHPHEP